ncbi:MAG: FAD-binding oxidoreductase [Bacteroidota bacterium]|nr:FAD-binding oxidoreductase [Candidatus Kapabacteria bacterium]MDW8220824.1 FAD-binding oxidoreductase [Bacteroidota bacterium]
MLIKTDQDTLQSYLSDASNMPGGSADIILIPETQAELREALIECTHKKIPMTLAGAGTGLTGARVPCGGAVISTERLTRIVSIDPNTQRAVVEPGVRLRDFQVAVEEHGLLYPPDPTERSAAMGGTVACNSSGARTFKYGATRAFVERLRVFLTNGDELVLRRGETYAHGNTLSLTSTSGTTYTLKLPAITMPDTKHVAGYFVKPNMDAIDLFIGSEGTLGAIAEIEVRLIPQPERIIAGVIFFDSFDGVMDFVEAARAASFATRAQPSGLGIDARALEYFDYHALNFVRSEYSSIPSTAVAAVWFEQEVSDATEEQLLERWYELISTHTALGDDAWFAITEKAQQELRAFRHAIPAKAYERIRELNQRKIGTDMAVPDSKFRQLYDFYIEEFTAAQLTYIIFGHIGNSHVHANIFTSSPEEFERAKAVYHRCVLKALELGGTISAEHGVGKIKRAYLQNMYGTEAVIQFAAMKRTLDPDGLLGRGTLFSEELLASIPLERLALCTTDE